MKSKNDSNGPDPRAKLGSALRALRTRRGWTLAEMGKRSGLPVSTISKLENDKVSLSYDKLTVLCEGLEVDIAELFAENLADRAPAQVSGRRSISRAGEGYVIDTDSYLHVYPAADLLNKRLVPIVAEVHARSLEEFGQLIRHSGEEYAYVLEGAIELHTELYAPARLETGDSIYFDSAMAHAYIAASPGRCRVLSVCSTSESVLRELLAEHGKRPGAALPAPAAAARGAKQEPAAKIKPKGRARAGKS